MNYFVSSVNPEILSEYWIYISFRNGAEFAISEQIKPKIASEKQVTDKRSYVSYCSYYLSESAIVALYNIAIFNAVFIVVSQINY